MNNTSRKIAVTALIGLVVIGLWVCFLPKKPQSSVSDYSIPALPPEQQAVYITNASEELTEKLRQQLNAFFPHHLKNSAAQQPKQSSVSVESLSASNGPENFRLAELAGNENLKRPYHVQWPLHSKRQTVPVRELWKPFHEMDFSHAKLGIVSSKFLDDRLDRFETEASYEANLTYGNLNGGFHATQTIQWEKQDDQWTITRWRQDSVELIFSGSQLFQDVTSDWVQSTQARKIISDSPMQDLLLKAVDGTLDLENQSQEFKWFHDWRSSARYSAISVVDFDGDGWDDLFLTGNLSQNLMLKNEQGQFKDVTQEVGFDIQPGQTSCGIFADFDNDGDVDALLGRSTVASQYFENNDGRFVLNSETSAGLRFCRFVSSGAVADINQDGFLDVYLSTYCANGGLTPESISQVVEPKHEKEFYDRLRSNHNQMLDRVGPPNILLANHDGKLKVAEIESPLLQWRHSYQPYWLDYDEDGDPDLYLCNDFSPDVMLRNDTEKGSFQFRFVDVTKELFGESLQGFGMGVSAGDFDSDGDLDLYVSNMYSKAGNRIFKRLKQVSQASRVAASGNFLFRNQGKSFEQIAHPKKGMHVAKVGWSLGGQFADFNNDGDLDLYVPSGLFTPPDRVAGQGDL